MKKPSKWEKIKHIGRAVALGAALNAAPASVNAEAGVAAKEVQREDRAEEIVREMEAVPKKLKEDLKNMMSPQQRAERVVQWINYVVELQEERLALPVGHEVAHVVRRENAPFDEVVENVVTVACDVGHELGCDITAPLASSVAGLDRLRDVSQQFRAFLERR